MYCIENMDIKHHFCSRRARTILLLYSCISIFQYRIKHCKVFGFVYDSYLKFSLWFANKRIPAVIITISTCLNVLFCFLWCHVYLLEEFISWMFTFSSISTCRECWHCREATREVTVHLLLNCTQLCRVKTVSSLNVDIKHRIVMHCTILFMFTTISFKFWRTC